ncbi:hypothetical protein DRJ22_01850 [Candidatus Woesearchaeota archaeon]|nr:MAG: hypothetical protein DRJ22_01850 [Candidatus Woesearchaeota archaeon]
MKITPKVAEEAIAESAGEEVLPLVRILKKRKNISEFQLAEQIKKEINITRNLLYRLYNINLVSFERVKDKKKGWYVYFWSFNNNKVKDLVIAQKKQRLERLKDRLKREENNTFFTCSDKCLRLGFEQAFDFEFKCPECGGLLEEEDNSKKIEELKKEIKELTKKLKEKIMMTKERPQKTENKKQANKKTARKTNKKKQTTKTKKTARNIKKKTKKKTIKKASKQKKQTTKTKKQKK